MLRTNGGILKIIQLSRTESFEKPDNYDEMAEWFKKRTSRHINLVKEYCRQIENYDPNRFKGLCEQAKNHDQSKFEDPEHTPYVYITWDYKCKEDGNKFEVPENIKDRMNEATQHHVSNENNKHHPECYSPQKVDLINRSDRDKPPEKIVDATKMPVLSLAEMVADWLSMSIEKKSNPKQWANKNVNVRWKFSDEQKDMIYELIENIWRE